MKFLRQLVSFLLYHFVAVSAIRIPPSQQRQRQQHEVFRTLSFNNNVNVTVPTDAKEHLVTAPLPLWKGDPFPTQHWAGHLPASSDGDKYFFYWLFAPEYSTTTFNKEDVPLVIWLNGGPGCSSMDGLFLENGPFRFVKDTPDGAYYLTAANFSWHTVPASTLYIDQPVGTGLSFTTSNKYPTNDQEVNTDFYYFLQQFVSLHGNYKQVYVSGESHAGHYIPSMMNYILQQNDNLKGGNVAIKLAGAAIGNGWMDPYHQYGAAEAAFGHGLVDRAQLNAMAAVEQDCQSQLQAGHLSPSTCFSLLDQVIAQSQGSKSDYVVSSYDARRTEQHGSPRMFPPGHKVVEAYLGGWDLKYDTGTLDVSVKDQVLKAIHATAATAGSQRYQECTDPPYNALSGQDGKGVVDDIVAVLEHASAPRLLFFNGMDDLICNHVGNERALENLPWKRRTEWVQATRYAWKAESEVESKMTGYMKEFENLMFLKMMNAGHMVPLDLPSQTLNMMQTFVYKKSFNTSPQSLSNAETKQCTASSVGGDCPTCVKCEKCPDGLTAQDTAATNAADASSKPAPASARIVIPWFFAGFSVALLAAYAVLRRHRRKSAQHQLVSQYDLEMRETTGSYADGECPDSFTVSSSIDSPNGASPKLRMV